MVLTAAAIPLLLALAVMYLSLYPADWSKAKGLSVCGAVLLFIGAVWQTIATAREIKESSSSWADGFGLSGWMVVVLGATFTFLGAVGA